METYVIFRRNGWRDGDALRLAAERSTLEGEKTPEQVRWIRSYVLAEGDETLGTVCVYEASSPEAILDHARRAELPADEVVPVVDTVIMRPDPQPVAA